MDIPSIRWHQRIVIDGWVSPGLHDVNTIFSRSSIPNDLSGLRVIDVGTTNGATAFECVRRGAKEVVATDICSPEIFGFNWIKTHLELDVQFVQASIYELPHLFATKPFDLAIFWGVLYHLRHPLLGLDALAQITRDTFSVETLVQNHDGAQLEFFRRDEAFGDASNWFAPSVHALRQMLGSAGLDCRREEQWGDERARRMVVEGAVAPGLPEFMSISYERRIKSILFSDEEPLRSA